MCGQAQLDHEFTRKHGFILMRKIVEFWKKLVTNSIIQ